MYNIHINIKMKIGIDIDDTTVITINSIIKYADKFHTSVLGRNEKKHNLGFIKSKYYLSELYGWTAEEKFDFFTKYYKNILEECKVMPDVAKVCQQLKKQGHSIYFITARFNNIENCNTEEITKKTLKESNIPYDKLIINAQDKLKFSEELGINIFIEDSYDTCVELANKGIHSILMTSKFNEKVDTGNIKRVHNWKEVFEQIQLINV